jgi:glutamyl-tRNA synthetase
VDDAAEGVTEVVRGDDLLPSTARQSLLQDALGLPHPQYGHVPLVTNSVGQRLAKREAALGLAELRARGVDPRRIVGWAASSTGLAAPELAHARDFVRAFSLGQIARQRPVAPEFR